MRQEEPHGREYLCCKRMATMNNDNETEEPYCLIPAGMDNYWFQFCNSDDQPEECKDCPENEQEGKEDKP